MSSPSRILHRTVSESYSLGDAPAENAGKRPEEEYKWEPKQALKTPSQMRHANILYNHTKTTQQNFSLNTTP